MKLVEVTNLQKRLGKKLVLQEISFAVHSGRITAIIGPNGAGKTTTVETLLGLYRPDAGYIRYWREDWRAFCGVQLQSAPLFPTFSTLENVQMFAALYGKRIVREEAAGNLETFGLSDVKKQLAGNLSGGQQKRLSLALALIQQPKLLFLDEPTGDLDPRGRHDVRTLIQNAKHNDAAIFLTSHDMEEVEAIADDIVLIHKGQIRAQGTPEALIDHYGGSLEAIYLNLTAEVSA